MKHVGIGGTIMRSISLTVAMFCLLSSTPLAQAYPVPNDLSIGLAVLKDHIPSQWSPSLVGALSWDYDEKWRATLVVEGEIGAVGEAESCQRSADDPPANCFDASIMAGLRFRPIPHASSGTRLFGQMLLGQYWKGSGTSDQQFISDHFTLQAGGGAEIRWMDSFQGLRVSADYRRVFAGNDDRNQIRFLCTYDIGPRRLRR